MAKGFLRITLFLKGGLRWNGIVKLKGLGKTLVNFPFGRVWILGLGTKV